MAIYHLSAKAVSRSKGRSATAAAAYRAGAEIHDQRSGQTHDYRRKQGVEHCQLILPDSAPAWAENRAALWNAAEQAEKRKDACVAREYEVALPAELTARQRTGLALAMARELVHQQGGAVDVAIHAPGRGGDVRNHHAHLLCTTRRLTPDGLGDKLASERAGRNRRADLEALRQRWADLTNDHLARAGQTARIDHRSLNEQGELRLADLHLGPAATALTRRHQPSRRQTDSQQRQNTYQQTLQQLHQARDDEQQLSQQLDGLRDQQLQQLAQAGMDAFMARFEAHQQQEQAKARAEAEKARTHTTKSPRPKPDRGWSR